MGDDELDSFTIGLGGITASGNIEPVYFHRPVIDVPTPYITYYMEMLDKYEPHTYMSGDGKIHFEMREKRKEENKMKYVKFKSDIDEEELKIYENQYSAVRNDMGDAYQLIINGGRQLIPKKYIEKEISEEEYNNFYNIGKIEKVDDRQTTDFRIRDIVKIRSYESLAKQFHIENSYAEIKCYYTFPDGMHFLIGQKAVIVRKWDHQVKLRFLNKEINDKAVRGGWEYCTDMIELVERGKEPENYIKRKKVYTVDDEIVKEMLSKVDINKIRKVLSSCFQIPGTKLLGITQMLEDWATNKRDIYLMFGKQFKISKDIEFEADDSMYQEKIEQLCGKFPIIAPVIKDISISRLKRNSLCIDTNNLDRVARTIKGSTNGMKITSFLSKAVNNPKFDTEFSKIIDETKVKGQITVSIDPIDYILMSINKSGWQSCHSLHESSGRSFGCYSAGVFSYMCDNCTAISFRHSKDQVEYTINGNTFKEYSKNWRECIYIDSDTGNFVASRQYPRADETIATSVRQLLEETISNYFGYNNNWKVNRNSDFIKQYMQDYCMDDECDWDYGSGALHYNDIWYGFNGAIIYNKDNNKLDETKIYVGSDPICPVCGENHLSDSGEPICWRCGEEY